MPTSTSSMAALPSTPSGGASSSSSSSSSSGATPRAGSFAAAANPPSGTGADSAMDELMAQYLRRRGYHVAPAGNSADVDMESGLKQERGASVASPMNVESGGRFDSAEPTTVEQYAHSLGLNTESCAANHILFYGMTGGDPSTYEHAYTQLMEWICNSLDMYKYELHAVAFPMFVHCFLELVAKGFAEHASAFLRRHAADHTRLHLAELRLLSMVLTPAHVRASEYAQQVLHSKFNVQMSLLSFELLNAFLGHEQLFLLLAILNERVNLIVTANQPGMQVEALDEALAGSVNNLDVRERASGYKTSDDVAQVVAASDQPNESEIGVPLTSGAYNVEYLVRAAGGDGSTLEDLHAIKMNWGLLKPRRLHADPDADASGAAGTKDDDDSGGNSTSANGGAGGATGGSGGSGDAGGNNSTDADKKGGASASSASAGDAGPGASSATGAKAGDKSSSGKAGDKNASAGAAADAQRKLKRAKLSTDAADPKKSDLEMMGPVPDRRSAFNADIMEKLVLRQPAEMKIQELEDLRARAPLSKARLPSALCFTFLNPSVHITDMCFSDDATLVGASCDDASFRVWRNDDQPLGTAKGAVYHGSVEETDEDERTAVLRGHGSAVYGASFSPDNRFALTGSADATVRLWSLASKSNLAIYRSHSHYPVWDVAFGPHGYYFASCSMDRTARLWSTDHTTPLRVFAGHLSDVDCVRFHPNHNYVATGSSDKTVRLWDVPSGKCIRIFTGHFHGVKALAFSRNGRYLASSGDDQYINIWDLHAGKRLETLVGHKGTVTSLDFSQESAILASSSLDATVRLWDMKALTEKAAGPPVAGAAGVARAPVTAMASSGGGGAFGAMGSSLVKPVHMVRASAMQELPTSRFLLKTLRSKQTPMYRVHYTSRNLLLSGGVFQPKTES
ncbi:hypothetical protein PybrP1_007209 [[Pythium] brassicae (nom. inval.)]|nr:hypothetical protein PybrP1_007209 [[Pythium] brassicae (nom. inval.)]